MRLPATPPVSTRSAPPTPSPTAPAACATPPSGASAASAAAASPDAPAPQAEARPTAVGHRPTHDRVHVHRTLALVDLDAFFVSVERQRDPSLEGRPVIVGSLPGERGVVACASYEARGYGVHAAMPIGQAAALLPPRCPRCVRAQSLAGAQEPVDGTPRSGAPGVRCTPRLPPVRCPHGCPVFLHGDHAAYAHASRTVMEVLERFTPAVEPVSLDEAYLDLTGLERHHRSWTAAAEALRAAVYAATGLSLSVGIGGTRAVAKVAASLAKPAGILVVRAGEERAFLAALALEHLPGVGAKTRATLERFNLRSIGDLAAMPDDLLAATFGRWGPALARRARGEEDEGGARVGERQPATRSISRETSFATDMSGEGTDDRRQVEATLSHLAQRAAKAMRAEGLRARSVGVRLRYSDFDTVEARQRFAAPTDLDHDILERLRALLHARWTRRVRLRLVGVVLHDLVDSDERQLDLALRAPPLAAGTGAPRPHDGSPQVAEALAPYVPHAVDRAIDRIRDRHGFGALVRGHAIDLLERPTHGPARRGFARHGRRDVPGDAPRGAQDRAPPRATTPAPAPPR